MASDDKFDRQVRLWGGHGQKKLQNAHVIMLGTSSMGSETLKNLVLPNVGMFTIVDNALVTARDFGNDFLVKRSHLGKNKAEALKEMLSEMNPDVKGEHIDLSIDDFIKSKAAEMIKSATLIIACDLNQNQAMQVSDICEESNNSLVLLRQYGMLGYLRVFKQEQTIIEKKSQIDPFKRDLRMVNPFPELKAFADKFDFETMENHHQVHTPYAVILIQAAEKWRAANDGQLPKTFAQKKQFKETIIKPMNKLNGQNFEEANNAIFDLWQPEIPQHIHDLLTHERVATGGSAFWCYLAALKKFIEVENRLPVAGVVPDMISTTEFYLELQQIYIKKAEEDRANMLNMLNQFVQEKGIEGFVLDQVEWLLFCKNLKQFTYSHMRSLTAEIKTPDWSRVANDFCDSTSCVKWLVVMRAFENLRVQGQTPGEDDANSDAEYALMRKDCDAVTASIEQQPIEEKYLREILRYGMSKVHNISAYMGGVAAQECLKLLIQQYMPINHTFVFDGIHGRGSTFDL